MVRINFTESYWAKDHFEENFLGTAQVSRHGVQVEGPRTSWVEDMVEATSPSTTLRRVSPKLWAYRLTRRYDKPQMRAEVVKASGVSHTENQTVQRASAL